MVTVFGFERWGSSNVGVRKLTPTYSLEEVGREIAKIEGVVAVHDLHIWTLASGKVSLSAHLELAKIAAWPRVLDATRRMLQRDYGIEHVTLQPEVPLSIEQPYTAQIKIHPR